MEYKVHPLYDWITVYQDGRIKSRNKFLKPRKTPNGYVKIVIQNRKQKVYKEQSIHKLVGEMFVPNPENKEQIHHIDRNKLNNHYLNLQWVTKEEHDLIHEDERREITRELMKGNKHRLGKFLT